LDLERLTPWFTANVPAVTGPLTASRIAGGLSNLSYVITDGTGSWVLRRPPLGHVLETAHDMGRECRVLSALAATNVPVPHVYGLCSDPDVLGAPFYVMDFVVGSTYRHASQLEQIGSERTAAVATSLIERLAAIHAVDPDEVGLQDFGRPQNFLGRQVQRWQRQLEASWSRELNGAHALYDELVRQLPEQSPAGLVHGDYRLDNTLVCDDDRIVAVVDWEMSTLGDPLTDLGMLAVYMTLPEILPRNGIADASAAPGFLTIPEVVAAYGDASDRELTGLDYYVALSAFKLAVISEGIHFRYQQGQTVGAGFDTVGDTVEPLLALGLEALSR
jgi:aminoglycoside phosphotransferase (APT) family kinase protein